MGTAKMSFMKLVIIQIKLGVATHFKLFLDPNSCRFTLVISIFGFVLKFMKSLKRRSRKLPSDDQYKNILLLDEEIEVSQTYYYFFFSESNHWNQNVCQNIPLSADIYRKIWVIILHLENFANWKDPGSWRNDWSHKRSLLKHILCAIGIQTLTICIQF